MEHYFKYAFLSKLPHFQIWHFYLIKVLCSVCFTSNKTLRRSDASLYKLECPFSFLSLKKEKINILELSLLISCEHIYEKSILDSFSSILKVNMATLIFKDMITMLLAIFCFYFQTNCQLWIMVMSQPIIYLSVS